MFRKSWRTFWVTHFYITKQATLLAFLQSYATCPAILTEQELHAHLLNIWEEKHKSGGLRWEELEEPVVKIRRPCLRRCKSGVRPPNRNKNEWKDGWDSHSCVVGNWTGFLGPAVFSFKRSFKRAPASMSVSELALTPGRWSQPRPRNSPAPQRLRRRFLWWRWCNRRNVARLTVVCYQVVLEVKNQILKMLIRGGEKWLPLVHRLHNHKWKRPGWFWITTSKIPSETPRETEQAGLEMTTHKQATLSLRVKVNEACSAFISNL